MASGDVDGLRSDKWELFFRLRIPSVRLRFQLSLKPGFPAR